MRSAEGRRQTFRVRQPRNAKIVYDSPTSGDQRFPPSQDLPVWTGDIGNSPYRSMCRRLWLLVPVLWLQRSEIASSKTTYCGPESGGHGPMKITSGSLLCAVILLGLASCAHVRQQFAAHERQQFVAYDGPQTVMRGEGGTNIVYDGIELWTTGTPPRSYRVVGVLTETRRHRRSSTASFGPDVAVEVRKVGGSAVIVLSEPSQFIGTTTTAQAVGSTRVTTSTFGTSITGYGTTNLFGESDSLVISDNTTRLLVVKYVD